MKSINNYRDYKCAFEIVRLFEEMIAEHGVGDTGKAKEHIIETKRAIRKYRNKIAEDAESRRIVKDYGIDGYVVLERVPHDFESKSEADDFFDEYMRIERPYSMYDCTGRPFTSWYRMVNRGGAWWCYHSIGFDV